MRGFVPVEDRPLESTITAFVGNPRELDEELAAVAVAAQLRSHVEVFEVDAVAAYPRREVEEPQREASDDRAVLARMFGDQAEQCRSVVEQRGRETGLRRDHRVGLALVGSKLTDQRQDRRDVVGPGWTDHARPAVLSLATTPSWSPTIRGPAMTCDDTPIPCPTCADCVCW